MEFETNHFSTYILAENNVVENTDTTISNENNNKLDETPKTGNIEVVSIILLVAVISLAGIIILKKK